MSNAIERFYQRARKAFTKETELPDFFVYHLTVELEEPVVTVQMIKDCYSACDLAIPSWLASHFSNGLKSNPKRFVKSAAGYRLEGKRREKIALALGVNGGDVQTSASLARLEALVPVGPKRDFLHETIKCYSAGANRAAVVMCWNLALHHLQEHVLAHGRTAFEQALATNTDTRVKIKIVSKHDDFTEMPEGKFLEFCRTAKILTTSMYNKLKGRLDDRNGAAHPSGVTTTPKFAEAFIEDLVENVMRKYAI
jgi:hypothetical protein